MLLQLQRKVLQKRKKIKRINNQVIRYYKNFFFLKKKSSNVKDEISDVVIPTEPKRPPTVYSLFYRDFFQKERSKHPEKVDVTQLAKLAGEQWSKLSDDEKKVNVFFFF